MITKAIVLKQMKLEGIDANGLTRDDIAVLKALFLNPKGLGIANLAGSTGIRKTTIEQIIEPFLKQRGLMLVSHKRFISDKGREYINE
jgi:Holliday junction resolvasome RuvABC ATP-dependent DNA helicase subunit